MRGPCDPGLAPGVGLVPAMSAPPLAPGESDTPPGSPLPPLSPESAWANEAQEAERVHAMKGVGRRGGVAAQSVSVARMQDYVKPVFPKAPEDKDRIRTIMKTHDKLSVLFGHLEENATEDVVNAFQPIEVPWGIDVIRQGDDGDRLYIINQGQVDIFVLRGTPMSHDDKGQKVVSFGAGALFGELALLYSKPRAATVTVASQSALLWALDRDAFQMLLSTASAVQLRAYEGWLLQVPLFQMLNHYEISYLADCVESQLFDVGEEIIRQGQVGDAFYIVEDGSCSAYINGEYGEKEVRRYEHRGEYFGEIALLNEEVRRATVRATGTGCAVTVLTKEQFSNLLGPLIDHMRSQAHLYPQYTSFF